MEVKAFIAIYMMVVISVGTGVVLLTELTTEEKLVFDDIFFSEHYDFISVKFRNVGTADIILEEALLNYRPYWDFREFGFRIPVGELQGIAFSHEWESNYPYTITLITNTGKIFSKSLYAPERHIALIVEEMAWNLTDTTISVVLSNIDRRGQNITDIGWNDFYDGGYYFFRLREISTSMNVSTTSEWEYKITIPAGQTTTIVLDWPKRDPWISGKTYFFYIHTEAGPDVPFNSKAP